MSSGHAPVGVVLTGGASSRMGTDKAFAVVAGRPMAVAVADALWEGGCHPVECQGGDVDGLAALGLDAVPDRQPGGGPVAAIADALERHDRPDGPIVVAACDLADLDAETVRTLVATFHERGRPVTVAEADGRRHLLSCWSPTALPALRTAIADGVRSYRACLERVGAAGVEVRPTAVRNVNTPDELG